MTNGYTMVGTRDLEKARAFYGPLFDKMGLEPCYSDEQVASWGVLKDDRVPRFFVCYPYDGEAATVGNGAMTTFRAETASRVRELHALAMAGGGGNEGDPGFRPERYGEKFYVAYVRHPDGTRSLLPVTMGNLIHSWA
ncbi:MAG: VOC family protein [Pseudomonadota bacterium]